MWNTNFLPNLWRQLGQLYTSALKERVRQCCWERCKVNIAWPYPFRLTLQMLCEQVRVMGWHTTSWQTAQVKASWIRVSNPACWNYTCITKYPELYNSNVYTALPARLFCQLGYNIWQLLWYLTVLYIVDIHREIPCQGKLLAFWRLILIGKCQIVTI